MPKDTIERAIQRGAGGSEGGNLEEITFEGLWSRRSSYYG